MLLLEQPQRAGDRRVRAGHARERQADRLDAAEVVAGIVEVEELLRQVEEAAAGLAQLDQRQRVELQRARRAWSARTRGGSAPGTRPPAGAGRTAASRRPAGPSSGCPSSRTDVAAVLRARARSGSSARPAWPGRRRACSSGSTRREIWPICHSYSSWLCTWCAGTRRVLARSRSAGRGSSSSFSAIATRSSAAAICLSICSSSFDRRGRCWKSQSSLRRVDSRPVSRRSPRPCRARWRSTSSTLAARRAAALGRASRRRSSTVASGEPPKPDAPSVELRDDDASRRQRWSALSCTAGSASAAAIAGRVRALSPRVHELAASRSRSRLVSRQLLGSSARRRAFVLAPRRSAARCTRFTASSSRISWLAQQGQRLGVALLERRQQRAARAP